MARDKSDSEYLVRWVIDFVNADLGGMATLDLYKKFLESQVFQVSVFRPEDPFLFKEKGFRHRVHEAISENLQESDLMKDGTRLLGTLEQIQGVYRHFLETLRTEGGEVKIGSFDVVAKCSEGRIIIEYRNRSMGNLLADNSEIEMRARLGLLLAIKELPSGSVRACRNCGKYYLHTSKRERYYCSPRCTSIHLARLKREENRVAYNKAQNEARKRQYRRQKAEKLGIPVEKVKIRPKKSKKR